MVREETAAYAVSGNGLIIMGGGYLQRDSIIWRDLTPELLVPPDGWSEFKALSLSESGDVAVGTMVTRPQQGPGQSANVIYTLQNGIMFAPEFFAMHGITFPETGRLTINCVSGNGLTFAGSYFDPILGVPTQGIIITIPNPAPFTILAAFSAIGVTRRRKHNKHTSA